MEVRDGSLYCFLLVAEELNISSAAKRLYISQQALSKRIQRLEEDFGVQLFTREPRLQLTGEGQRVLAYAKRVLAEERDLRNSLRQDRLNTVRLPIGLATDCGDVLIAPLFDRFRYSYPEITLAFSPCAYSDLSYLLRIKRIRAAIGMLHVVGRRCFQIPLFSEEVFLVVRKDLFLNVSNRKRETFLSDPHASIKASQLREYDIPLIIPWRASRIGNELITHLYNGSELSGVIAEAVTFAEMMPLCEAGYGGAIVFGTQLSRNLSWCASQNMLIFPITELQERCMIGLIINEEDQEDELIQDLQHTAVDVAQESICKAALEITRYRMMQYE